MPLAISLPKISSSVTLDNPQTSLWAVFTGTISFVQSSHYKNIVSWDITVIDAFLKMQFVYTMSTSNKIPWIIISEMNVSKPGKIKPKLSAWLGTMWEKLLCFCCNLDEVTFSLFIICNTSKYQSNWKSKKYGQVLRGE